MVELLLIMAGHKERFVSTKYIEKHGSFLIHQYTVHVLYRKLKYHDNNRFTWWTG